MNSKTLRSDSHAITWPQVSRRRIAILVALFGLVVGELCSGGDDPPQVNSKPATRAAKRPALAAIQSDRKLASQTKVEFRHAEELAYRDFNELVLQVGTFDSPHAAELNLPSKFQLLCYNGQPVGPTIRVKRGTTFHIHLKNNLPIEPDDPSHSVNATSEQPHDFCTTNLHTHGLHVSPTGNADNVFVSVKPQEDVTYEFNVPADHPSGTFWYHPHHHGSVAYQLSNGVAGALIIEGSPRDNIADLNDIPEIAAAKERIMLLQLYNYRVDPAGADGVARIDATTIYDVRPNLRACPAIAVPNTDPVTVGQATAINGVISPIIRIAPGEVQRWRLIHGAWDVNRRLYLDDAQGHHATDLQFNEIAIDGMATGTMVPKGNNPDDPSGLLVEVGPGQRSDVLIQAPRLTANETERIYFLCQSAQEVATGMPQPNENLILAKIIVSGRPMHMRLPDSRELAKCQPFASIRDEELTRTGASELATAGLNFFATAPGSAVPRFWINKKTYTQYKTPVQIRLNTAEEWKVTAVSENHPFHIHVNPFQVVMRMDSEGKNCKPMNVWRDTLYIQKDETYLVRSRFKDFLGKTVIHCHFLDHEDQGMMLPIEFIPPYQTPKPADTTNTAGLKPTSIPAPPMKLADPNGTWHELAQFRPRNTVLVFFQGMECSHCSQQLGKLVRDAESKIGSETEIIAVSSRRIADLDRAVTTLGAKAKTRFHLLVDEDCEAFRKFGCYQDGPKHGLFVIDRNGIIRASYTGETPFDDVQAVSEQIKTLTEINRKSAAK
ncbi:MAG: hypothetical protein JWM11_6650 [Planctomycetaceae bacterium]|nr:hypothetical protein [Planctomycetaceae bacterium]